MYFLNLARSRPHLSGVACRLSSALSSSLESWKSCSAKLLPNTVKLALGSSLPGKGHLLGFRTSSSPVERLEPRLSRSRARTVLPRRGGRSCSSKYGSSSSSLGSLRLFARGSPVALAFCLDALRFLLSFFLLRRFWPVELDRVGFDLVTRRVFLGVRLVDLRLLRTEATVLALARELEAERSRDERRGFIM